MTSVHLAVALLLVIAFAGCTTPAAYNDVVATSAAGEVDPVLVEGATNLGWIAAVGWSNAYVDAVVGARAYEHCPEADFVAPSGATDLSLSLTQTGGAGLWYAVVASPTVTTFYDASAPFEEPVDVKEPAPEPGSWTVEVVPLGGVVMGAWNLTVSYTEPAPAAESVVFTLDPKCGHLPR